MKLNRAGKDATPTDDASPTPVASRKHNNLVPAAVLAVGLLGGGFFMGGQGSAGTAGAATPPPEASDHEDAGTGPVQSLEPITLNLADGHFLKVGIALQLAENDPAEGGHEVEEVAAAKALDVAISLLGSHTKDELADPDDRDKVKDELSERVGEAYTDPATGQPTVTKVYFTEFVMQ